MELTKHWHAEYQPRVVWGNPGKVTEKAGMASFPFFPLFLLSSKQKKSKEGHREKPTTPHFPTSLFLSLTHYFCFAFLF